MPIDRSLGRNVHFYDASKPGVALGGLIQNGSVTEANFLDMIGILLITEPPLRVQERTSGHIVTATNNSLGLGEYDVYSNSPIEVNNEPWVHRLITHSVSGREDAFRHGIRARDGKCVISGVVNRGAYRGNWSGFEAAHIFPLESESYWIEKGYSRWITDMDNTNGVSKIHSLQNGFLLRGDIHQDFDQYLLSVNPDDNYKIVVFGDDNLGLDGRILDPVCRDPANPHRVPDQLLRWHFRQSVFANMRGAGEPIFEHDFPPGTDMMGTIREEPYAQERLEMEFAWRLRGIG
ncbi:HNH endonuclease-domain-containing protein [Sphaerosporella brunnea]|uniref:HNH endonuclease-domain-containing protein n=1 Tax=Sphaerosporella brunnea TaxID=1250544 RepID=A0A5J5ETD9_9PEZI|nr:HNH endonuclease-domain-containing protein [Sphaerosporella brunnea]